MSEAEESDSEQKNNRKRKQKGDIVFDTIPLNTRKYKYADCDDEEKIGSEKCWYCTRVVMNLALEEKERLDLSEIEVWLGKANFVDRDALVERIHKVWIRLYGKTFRRETWPPQSIDDHIFKHSVMPEVNRLQGKVNDLNRIDDHIVNAGVLTVIDGHVTVCKTQSETLIKNIGMEMKLNDRIHKLLAVNNSDVSASTSTRKRQGTVGIGSPLAIPNKALKRVARRPAPSE